MLSFGKKKKIIKEPSKKKIRQQKYFFAFPSSFPPTPITKKKNTKTKIYNKKKIKTKVSIIIQLRKKMVKITIKKRKNE